MLATTMLLECFQQEKLSSKHDEITLNYGYHAAKTLLLRSERSNEIWETAAFAVFEQRLTAPCVWEVEKGRLQLNFWNYSLSVDLQAQAIDGDEDFKSRLLPKKMATSYRFEMLFGENKRPLCSFDEMEILKSTLFV